MDVIGITGPRIRLVPLDRERHLENYVRWFNDPEVTRYLLQNLPLSRPEEEKFFERTAENEASVVWAIHDENDRHIGGTGLDQINWKERAAVSGIIIGEKDAWGKGYGTEVMQVRTTYAFEQLGLHRIESECFADNVASVRCLEKAGYQREGVARRKYWREGRWHDAILWAILEEDYFGST